MRKFKPDCFYVTRATSDHVHVYRGAHATRYGAELHRARLERQTGFGCFVDSGANLNAEMEDDRLCAFSDKCLSIIGGAQRDGVTIDNGNVVDLIADNTRESIDYIRKALWLAGISKLYPIPDCRERYDRG